MASNVYYARHRGYLRSKVPGDNAYGLETTAQIRNALGDCYDFIKSFDQLPVERRKTAASRARLLKLSQLCGSCGTADAVLEAAHLLALEDGGLTQDDNFILLCHRCHQLYDLGFASLVEMRQAASAWRTGTPLNVINLMLQRWELARSASWVRPAMEVPQGVYAAAAIWRFGVALKLLYKRANDPSTFEVERSLCLLAAAQMERRRAARGSLARAHRVISRIDPGSLPAVRRAVFYYERGYIDQLAGRHQEASALFLESSKQATEIDDQYSPLETLIGKAQYLATRVISLAAGDEPQAIIANLHTAELEAAKLEGTFAGRWRLNCKLWEVLARLKVGDLPGATVNLAEAKAIRDAQVVTTGWTGGVMLSKEGLLAALGETSDADFARAIRLLSRALVVALEGRPRRPETIRDMLFGFAQAHRRWRGNERRLDRIDAVRQQIKDGSSALDPWKV